MKVSIIIVNFNGKEDTLACLESLEKMKVPEGVKMEVLVVDNNSSDGSVEAFRERSPSLPKRGKQGEFYKVKIIQNNDNHGFAKGNNIGIKKALDEGADYVKVLNNDTLVDRNLLKELLAGMERHPRAGMLVPKIYFAKGHEYHKDRYKKNDLGKVIWAAGGEMDWNNVYGINIGIDEVDRGQYDVERPMEKAPGTCVLMRREMLETVGMFDERYFMYHEDDDLSMRAREAGWEIWYVPSAKIWHVSGASSGIGSPLMDYFTTRNRMLFGMRYAPLRAKFALIRESIRLLFSGREWQRRGVKDFYLRKFGRGSWGQCLGISDAPPIP